MRLAKNLLLVIAVFFTQFSPALAFNNKKKKKKAPIEFSSLDNLLEKEFFLELDQRNFSQDITTTQQTELSIYFDPVDLAVSPSFPQIIKFEIYRVDEADEEQLLSVVNQSYKNIKKLKKTLLNVPLPTLIKTSKIVVKVYDSEGVEAGIFETNIQVENNSTEDIEEVIADEVLCTGSFGQCQMDFLMKNFNIVGVNSKQPATIITKEKSGEYIARIPLVAQGKKRVKTKIKVKGGGSSVNKNSTIAFENKSEQVKAQMGWDEISDSLKISFPGSDRSFTFSEEGLLNISKTNDSILDANDSSSLSLQDGDATQVPIQIEAGILTTSPVDGAIEYDGTNLYFTSGGNRRTLGSSVSTVISGGSSTSLIGPTNSVMLKSGANSLTGTSSLDFVSGTLRVNNAIVFQSLNAENYTGAQTLDWSTGNQKRVTLTGNTTLTFSDPAGFCSLLLEINQDATGARNITWPGNVLWSSGTTPVLSTAANAIDVVTCFFNGTNYLCQAGLDFQ